MILSINELVLFSLKYIVISTTRQLYSNHLSVDQQFCCPSLHIICTKLEITEENEISIFVVHFSWTQISRRAFIYK